MATGGNPPTVPIWDRHNADQQELVYFTPCRRLLEIAGVVLRENLCTDDVLPHLRQLEVMKKVDMECITYNAPRPVVVDRLVVFLLKSQMWQFHGLLRACAVTGQKQLIRQMGLEPSDYITEEEESQIPQASSEQSRHHKTTREAPSTRHSCQRKTMPAQLLKAIVHHCKNCKRCLMQKNLYDFGDKDALKVINTTKCYIKIDPLREGEGGNMMEIMEKDLLLALPGEDRLCVIRLEGQPGTGKTALTHHIVYDWSVEFLKRVEEAIPIEVGGDMFTTMVYIAARDIKTTVPEAILDNLRCPREEKAIMYDHVTKGNGTAIALDAIDEIRDPKVLQNVKEYIKERQKNGDGPVVLVTARTDLCPINIPDINRFVTVHGFSVNQGLSYIKAYLKDDDEVCQKVLDYVQAHQKQLYPIVTNPLRLHIFCALVSEGELELEGNFSILKLFTLLERCLLKREGKEVTEVELHNFYRMCMFGLLNGLREFSKDLLDRFNIPQACHVFFTKKDITDLDHKKVTFSFPHESIYEFLAGRYIETLSLENKMSLVLAICAQSAFRNLQKIIFGVILQQEEHQQELLLLMIRAIIILQYRPSKSKSLMANEKRFSKVKRALLWKLQYDELTILKSKLQPVESVANMVGGHHQPTEVKNTRKICGKIHKAFDGMLDFLRGVKWYHGLENGVFGHIYECLQACSPKQKENLTSKTTEKLLPCHYEDKHNRVHMVHAVGGSRWAEVVRQENDYPVVKAWCPADLQEVLYKVRMAGFTTGRTELIVNIRTYQDTWGPPDSSAFCTQAWNELHKELTQWKVTGTESKVPDCDLKLGPSTPLQGLLQSDLGGVLSDVRYGTIGLEELYQVLTAPHLPVTQRCVRGEDCDLFSTTIVVPAGGDKALLTNMKGEILSKRRPSLWDNKFVTEAGEKYHWS